jgi:MYXO-CTERM domain-containing protein
MKYVVALALLVAAPAEAHIGAILAQARFSNPPTPKVTPSDMGVIFDNTYPWASADQAFNVTWDDGDNDPTGNFSFYYTDHQPTFQLLAIYPMNLNLLTPIAAATGDPGTQYTPVSIFAGCDCNPDAGIAGSPIVCPDAGGPRDCRNSFMWDTSKVTTPGSYWIVAVNNDDPLHLASVANGPVRIAHGGNPPPAVIVLRPDGFNSFDKTYRVQWAATGTAPLKFDLAYGLDDTTAVLMPPTPLGSDVQAISNADGTWSWDWDISALDSLKVYYFRVTVTDANGVKAFTDSRYGLSVYHPVDNGDGGMAPPDLAVVQLMPTKSGCSCDLTGPASPLALVPLALLALVLLVRRRA